MNDIKSKENKVKKERSSAYPAVSLEEAINAVAELSKKLGSGPYSRETAAQALGYKGISGASATKIAALAHFGLLKKEGSAYKQSSLSKRILVQKTEEDNKKAISEAFLTPKLYARLFKAYAGKGLPTLLDNILYHDFGIILSSSKEAAETFKRSAEFAGLLKNGVLRNAGEVISEEITEEEENADKDQENEATVNSFAQSKGHFPVRLPSGIVISFPQEMSYDFGLGKFAKQIKELEEIAKKIVDEKE